MIISFRRADLLDAIRDEADKAPTTYLIKMVYDENEMPMSRLYFDMLTKTGGPDDTGRWDYIMNLIPELLEKSKEAFRNIDHEGAEDYQAAEFIVRRFFDLLRGQDAIKMVDREVSQDSNIWIIELVVE